MGAKYVSDKKDGYLSTRNEVYRDREKKLEVRATERQDALRNLPTQTKENYGKKQDK